MLKNHCGISINVGQKCFKNILLDITDDGCIVFLQLVLVSEGMGHDNEETTRIYLASIQTNQIRRQPLNIERIIKENLFGRLN